MYIEKKPLKKEGETKKKLIVLIERINRKNSSVSRYPNSM